MKNALIALALLAGNAYASNHFQGRTPKKSFYNMSVDQNAWTEADTVGCIIGYTIFGLLYVYTVGYIFYDTHVRGKDYDELLQNDLAEMQKLGMDLSNPEFQAGLAEKLSGVKADDRGDDQLFGTAAQLDKSVWQAHVE